MFSMRERRKSKHKFGGTKVCKAEEVRKYFLNSKIENQVFRECKLHYLQFRFQKYIMNALFIAHENNEWCHFVVCIESLALVSFYCVCFLFSQFFLLFFFCVNFTTCLGIEVNLSILKLKQWNCSQIPKWSFDGLVASALLSN